MNGENNDTARPAGLRTNSGYNWFDTLMVWCAVLFGYLMIRLLPLHSKPSGEALLLLALYVVAFIWFRKSGVKPTVRSLVFASAGIAVLPAFVISSDDGLAFLLFFAELLVWLYFVYTAPGNAVEADIGRFFWLDAVKAVIAMPLSSLFALPCAAVGNTRGMGKKIIVTLLWILLGLVMAIIPALIVIELLSFDANFREIIDKICGLDIEWLTERLVSLIFGLPLAFWGFAAFISSRQRKLSDKMTGEQCGRAAEAVRVFPAPLIYATMTPVLILYVIFFVSQWGYFTAAFYGVLPEGFVYSSYARQGFFQLCSVASLNALALIFVSIFVRRESRAERVLLKVYSVITSLFTLVLIATALSKMALYISAYGLTLKRVYASWFIIFMAAGFIYAIIANLVKRFRFNFALLLTGALMFGAIAYANVSGLIADYNADAYLDGRLGSVDIYEISRMGDSGIPALVRLAGEAEDSKVADEAVRSINEYLELNSDRKDNILTFSLPRARAEALLERKGYID
ncbi:MAG TPA: DUF4173 domain-containing protein [Bacillota bacterium]|nr:DUF4173 domain-containing protein [Bacillota bacterium]